VLQPLLDLNADFLLHDMALQAWRDAVDGQNIQQV